MVRYLPVRYTVGYTHEIRSRNLPPEVALWFSFEIAKDTPVFTPSKGGQSLRGEASHALARAALSPSMLPWQFPPPPLTAHDADTPSPPAAAPIVHVMSLGSLCCTARFMEAHGLRVYAGPFD